MKVIGILCCLNESELLDSFMKINLPLVDKLIVAEGGVIGHPFCTENGRSIDNTVDILLEWKEKYPDKIEFTGNNTKWSSKQAQQNSLLDYLEDGDWCWVMAVDELYQSNTRNQLNSLFERYPRITEFIPSFIHFWDKDHYIIDKETKDYRVLQRHQRIFKYENFMFYVNHPTINNSSNEDTFFTEKYTHRRMILDVSDIEELPIHFRKLSGIYNSNSLDAIIVWHYGFIKKYESQLRKSIYYLMRDRDMKPLQALSFVRDKIKELGSIFGYINQIHSSNTAETALFNDSHPLENFEWNNNEDIDFDNIHEIMKNFEEKPKK